MHKYRSRRLLAILVLAPLVASAVLHPARADDRQAPGHDTCQSRSCGGHGQFATSRNGRWR